MRTLYHRFPRYGTAGLVILLLMETAIVASGSPRMPDFRWDLITGWATPICWWGYILVVDAWIYRRKGTSLLTYRRNLFVLLCILSITFWCLFEAYNRIIPGWRYVNLDPELAIRFVGYALAFATIMPGMFLTCELLQTYELFSRINGPALRWSKPMLNLSQALGALFCIAPIFMPYNIRGYLWVCIWVGWILFLEPINYRRGIQSIYRDWERGDFARTVQLGLAGVLCGLLWEFWNYWAYTKWEYIFPVPIGASLRYFEMPLIGFLGFIPFAIEYFVMFHLIAGFFTREDKLGL